MISISRLNKLSSTWKTIKNYGIPCCNSVRNSSDDKTKVKREMFCQMQCEDFKRGRKVSIIGAAGNVGLATAVNFFFTNSCDELVLMDVNQKKLCGEFLDLEHCYSRASYPKVKMCTDFSNTANSSLVVISAGIPQKGGQSRLELIKPNVELFKEIIPKIVQCSPKCVILVVTNPVDIMSYFAWKFSCFEKNRVLGVGCDLDSSRFRYLIGKRLGISPMSVHAWVVGEHGDSSVPLWTSVNVAGTRLREVDPKVGTKNDSDNWNELHKEVVRSGGRVHGFKGHTNWAIACCAYHIGRTILSNKKRVHCVSTSLQGLYGIETDVFLSIPCVIGNRGVAEIVQICMNDNEIEKFNHSACLLHNVKESIPM